MFKKVSILILLIGLALLIPSTASARSHWSFGISVGPPAYTYGYYGYPAPYPYYYPYAYSYTYAYPYPYYYAYRPYYRPYYGYSFGWRGRGHFRGRGHEFRERVRGRR